MLWTFGFFEFYILAKLCLIGGGWITLKRFLFIRCNREVNASIATVNMPGSIPGTAGTG